MRNATSPSVDNPTIGQEPMEIDGLAENAKSATEFLKTLAHEQRLLILCSLSEGERTVSDIEQLLSARQPAVSQQLSRLRLEGMVSTRREGRTVYYRLANEKVRRMMPVVYELFCSGQ